MKRFRQNVMETLADAALLEMGISGPVINRRTGFGAENLEENFIEVAFAEAADHDEIHEQFSENTGRMGTWPVQMAALRR